MINEIKDLLELRKVRNSCSQFMTRDQSHISLVRQFIWYLTVFRPRCKKGLMKLQLFHNSEGAAIGYGLLNIDGDKEWVSGGLIPAYRKLAIGKLIFLSLVHMCHKTPWLEVLRKNKSAIKLYKNIGFKKVKQNDLILIMKYEK